MAKKAYEIPQLTSEEKLVWTTVRPARLFVDDRIVVRELVTTTALEDGTRLVEKEFRRCGPRQWLREVNTRQMRRTEFEVSRVTDDYVFIDYRAVDGVPVKAFKRTKLSRTAPSSHLKDVIRFLDSGPSDRTVDPVIHSVAANCEKFLLTVDQASPSVDVETLKDALFEITPDARYGDPELTETDLEALFTGRLEPRPWVWKVVQIAATDPNRFRQIYV